MKTRGFEIVENKKFPEIETFLPKKGTKESAGYDFFSKEDYVISPGKSHIFWTDIKSYMLQGEVLKLYVRSSLGIKKGLILQNQVGIIDKDYYNNSKNEGNIGICLYNSSKENQVISKEEKIAQGIFMNFLISDNGNSEEERKGGIGSTS